MHNMEINDRSLNQGGIDEYHYAATIVPWNDGSIRPIFSEEAAKRPILETGERFR